METTLFEVQDQYENSLKDFKMNVDYELAYLTQSGEKITALSQSSNVGRAMYDPDTLPQKPADFKCLELTTRINCMFYTVDQKRREIYSKEASGVKISARKKKITKAQKIQRAKDKGVEKRDALVAKFGNNGN